MMLCTFTLRKAVVACAVALAIIAVAGCGSIVSPDVSAMVKIGTGQVNTLSGPEIQALTTSPLVAAYAPGIALTDAQANAIAEFLADNNIASLTDLQTLIAKVQADPTSIQLPDGFFELFKDFKLPTTQPSA